MNPFYVSVHFPKAGGTSLLVQLQSMLGDGLLLDYEHDPIGPRAAEEVDHRPSNYKMVHGHFRPSRYSKLENRFLLTFLRNPVDNLMSIYFFWRDLPATDNYWHLKFLDEKPSILEFAKYNPFRRMSDAYFGNFDMDQFDFIGFHEDRVNDYPLLGSMIDLPISGKVHANKTENHRDERLATKQCKKTMDELSNLLADDLEFYNRLYAKRKL